MTALSPTDFYLSVEKKLQAIITSSEFTSKYTEFVTKEDAEDDDEELDASNMQVMNLKDFGFEFGAATKDAKFLLKEYEKALDKELEELQKTFGKPKTYEPQGEASEAEGQLVLAEPSSAKQLVGKSYANQLAMKLATISMVRHRTDMAMKALKAFDGAFFAQEMHAENRVVEELE